VPKGPKSGRASLKTRKGRGSFKTREGLVQGLNFFRDILIMTKLKVADNPRLWAVKTEVFTGKIMIGTVHKGC
jgi:hypothetical protein